MCYRKKFDCRIYVMLAGLRPITAFVCKEGLARFCTVVVRCHILE